MHWFWKLLILLGALLVIGVVGLMVAIYIALPSPAKLREGMFAKATSVVVEHRARKSNAPAASNAPPNSNASTDADAAARAKVEENERAFSVLLDKTAPLSQACDSLREIKYPQHGKLDAAEFGKRFKNSLGGERNDPEFESLKPVLKFTLTQPVMRDVVDRIRTAKPQSIIEEIKSKKDFYFRLAEAYEEMKNNKGPMEEILDRSYLTMMLGRAVEAHPSVASDIATSDFCHEVESALNQGRADEFANHKKAFESLLADKGIDPKSIGYDPAYKTRLQINFNEHGLHFNGGWIDEVFGQLAPPAKK